MILPVKQVADGFEEFTAQDFVRVIKRELVRLMPECKIGAVRILRGKDKETFYLAIAASKALSVIGGKMMHCEIDLKQKWSMNEITELCNRCVVAFRESFAKDDGIIILSREMFTK